jgi:hypothetical protein
MKKTLLVLMLTVSVTGTLMSQSKADKVFEIPSSFSFGRRFTIDLGMGNYLKVELSDLTDLDRVYNIDSLLRTVLNDMELIKDSLSDPLTGKRIDYVIDKNGSKKMRFTQTLARGSSFLINPGEPAALKIEQDSLFITGIVQNAPKPMDKISKTYPRYYKFSFYLNDITTVSRYIGTGLNQKLSDFRKDYATKWDGVPAVGFHLKKDPSISASQRRAQAIAPKDYLAFQINISAQNYKKYFVPSFSLGVAAVYSNADRKFRREFGLYWQPQFLFANDANNKLQTYRNDFLELTLAQGLVKDNDPRKETSFLTTLSFSYLVYRQGDFYDKGTMRLAGGKFRFHKSTLEPAIYFTDLFRGVTPSLRFTQQF